MAQQSDWNWRVVQADWAAKEKGAERMYLAREQPSFCLEVGPPCSLVKPAFFARSAERRLGRQIPSSGSLGRVLAIVSDLERVADLQ